jgi:hypothetical protein
MGSGAAGAAGQSHAAALAAWADFPVQQSPRPVVFLDERVRTGDQGFVDGAAKRAFLSGAIESSVALPRGVLDLLTATDWDGPAPSLAPLRVESVRSVEAPFNTDRGPRRLPAFELLISGLAQPCAVLDPQLPLWWPRTAEQWLAEFAGDAQLEADGRTLQIAAFGGYLTEFLGVEFVESETAVIAKPLTRERPVPEGTAIPAIGFVKHVTGTLPKPLGGRVLINHSAIPYCVTTVE